jgi:hypothetical protein
VISRRKFLSRSSEAGAAIAITRAGLGTVLSEPINRCAASESGPSETARRAQQSFEIRCEDQGGQR